MQACSLAFVQDMEAAAKREERRLQRWQPQEQRLKGTGELEVQGSRQQCNRPRVMKTASSTSNLQHACYLEAERPRGEEQEEQQHRHGWRGGVEAVSALNECTRQQTSAGRHSRMHKVASLPDLSGLVSAQWQVDLAYYEQPTPAQRSSVAVPTTVPRPRRRRRNSSGDTGCGDAWAL